MGLPPLKSGHYISDGADPTITPGTPRITGKLQKLWGARVLERIATSDRRYLTDSNFEFRGSPSPHFFKKTTFLTAKTHAKRRIE